MKSVVKDNRADWDRFVNNMKQLKKGRRVNVGIFQNQGEDLVEYAAANEFGTEKIPERSFLRAGIDEARRRGDIQRKVADLLFLVVTGKISPLAALVRLGIFGAEIVKKKIDQGPFAALAPSTIRRKGSDVPLIESGRMRRNITSRIR